MDHFKVQAAAFVGNVKFNSTAYKMAVAVSNSIYSRLS